MTRNMAKMVIYDLKDWIKFQLVKWMFYCYISYGWFKSISSLLSGTSGQKYILETSNYFWMVLLET